MAVIVDTNVIIDVITDDNDWADWSIAQLQRLAPGGLVINPAIYAELCYGFPSHEPVDELVAHFQLAYAEIPRVGLFKAAKAFRAHKRRGGIRGVVLPDFFVGGHAEAAGMAIVTRDIARFRTYFPSVPLICPGQVA